MSAWQEKNAALLASLAETPNPDVRSGRIMYYLCDAGREYRFTQGRFFQAEDKRYAARSRNCLWSCTCSKSNRAVRYYIKEEIEPWHSSAST